MQSSRRDEGEWGSSLYFDLILHARSLSSGAPHPSTQLPDLVVREKIMFPQSKGIQIYSSLISLSTTDSEGYFLVDVWNWKAGEVVWVSKATLHYNPLCDGLTKEKLCLSENKPLLR